MPHKLSNNTVLNKNPQLHTTGGDNVTKNVSSVECCSDFGRYKLSDQACFFFSFSRLQHFVFSLCIQNAS